MNAYLAALKAAAIAGYYVPEIELIYLRHENFMTPHALALNFLH